jgi:hypothetical protein
MEAAYGIKRIDTGLLFAGFDPHGQPLWGVHGVPMTKDQATAQALLLARFNQAVQKKPVTVI